MIPISDIERDESISNLLKALKHRLVKLFSRNAPAIKFLRLHEKFTVTERPTPKGRVLWVNSK